ncbi:hypothetical protein JN06_01685 [Bacteroides zoogleoformans]|uniref:Uncharacterized protein n=1 Tax=Bacteroides zoogleoformans TaxID=28119 RepID=A0ABN5IG96_9BACE|nr:hypothetical protein [Bacteroides zoogleoformans]AVM51760.1 hypothetical protein C4H11_01220 [Bacteroides zoogleoformans]TWJ13810.1 hypothetical protein JN06_01685 [Bacteroides zoogleoformans]
MKKGKDELEEVNFQIYRLKYEVQKYIERCKILEVDPSEKVDELLERLSKMMAKREKLMKE